MYQINGDMDINGAFESTRKELLIKQEIQDSEISVFKNEFESESIGSGNCFHNCEIIKNETLSSESDENGNQLILKLEESNCSVNVHGSCGNSKTYKFKCKLCLCITNSLPNHFSREHKDEELIYICKFCDFETKYMGNLKEHENSKHEKENYHLCHICGFKALYRSNLNRHIRHVHLKYENSNMEFNERYVCMYCAFVTKRWVKIYQLFEEL
ncbi:hypothetical protein WA026_011154 [Henosepilachna vigintioctopunctata]|uniref:C2H2-type domain-containing protein n=1 Tax=Henosepilachna vigintioctopunctata TaxID=420089 RepID=A0AAW1U9Q0_9CUCU